MGKLTIYIKDELFEKLSILNEDKASIKGKKIISRICQRALEDALKEAEASNKYREAGVNDGKNLASVISEEEKEYILMLLDKEGHYEKWSDFEIIEELDRYFTEIKKRRVEELYPQINDFAKGTVPALHEWIANADQIKQDRINEMFWDYRAGCFEGIYKEHLKNTKRKKR